MCKKISNRINWTVKLILVLLLCTFNRAVLAEKYQGEEINCPKDAKLIGQFPPKGSEVRCILIDNLGSPVKRYGENVRHGTEIIWHPTEHIWSKGYYQNGLPHGCSQEWYEDGQLESVTCWKQGKKHGEWRGWYENGQQKYVSNYINDIPVGEYRYWNEAGTQITIVIYEDGKEISRTNKNIAQPIKPKQPESGPLFPYPQ